MFNIYIFPYDDSDSRLEKLRIKAACIRKMFPKKPYGPLAQPPYVNTHTWANDSGGGAGGRGLVQSTEREAVKRPRCFI
jgi:hypothetical protein